MLTAPEGAANLQSSTEMALCPRSVSSATLLRVRLPTWTVLRHAVRNPGLGVRPARITSLRKEFGELGSGGSAAAHVTLEEFDQRRQMHAFGSIDDHSPTLDAVRSGTSAIP